MTKLSPEQESAHERRLNTYTANESVDERRRGLMIRHGRLRQFHVTCYDGDNNRLLSEIVQCYVAVHAFRIIAKRLDNATENKIARIRCKEILGRKD